jgi:hypothetical protein
MNSTPIDPRPVELTQACVASYRTHTEAEAAVRLLAQGSVALDQISIIGRNYETQEDVQGFYRPADAALDGAKQGAWFGGIFGLMLGAMGFFVFPIVGAVMVLGPLASMIVGAVGGAGAGALINGMVASGIPKDQALEYQERLQAGEFLVVVHGDPGETARAHTLLAGTNQLHLQTHSILPEAAATS